MTKRFDTVLIANRGEVARRIGRTAHALGLRTVAVFAQEDRHEAFVDEADLAICLGPGGPADTYLDIEKVLGACNRGGATAVHPGYGFLSENAAFARRLGQAGIVWVGPGADAMEQMGSKIRAKQLMSQAGVPLVPGYHGDEQGDEILVAQAARVGFPLFIKAAAGGGGRGMRRVERLEDFLPQLARARSEARGAFGQDDVLLERALDGARHVEIQVFGDEWGNLVHLGARDCSVQRRHQKVIEESPAPHVPADTIEAMALAALRAAKAVAYVGAGTVEFLLSPAFEFYFLEMNTRLQVEHPVTEACFGVDLVAWQFHIAQGLALPLPTQGAISEHALLSGAHHAIEVRVYAEDPAQGFMPQVGRFERLEFPREEGIRIECSMGSGAVMSARFDPMVAKLIATGQSREHARARLIRALGQSVILGVVTNRDFLLSVLEHREFALANLSTDFLDTHSVSSAEPLSERHRRLFSALLVHRLCDHQVSVYQHRGATQTVHIAAHGQEWKVSYRASARGRIEVEGEPWRIEEGEGTLWVSGPEGVRERWEVSWDMASRTMWAQNDRHTLVGRETSMDAPSLSAAGDELVVYAPMAGRLLALEAEDGAQVGQGDLLGVLEAMKMEHKLLAPVAGLVRRRCEPGEQVVQGAVLFEMEAKEDAKADPGGT